MASPSDAGSHVIVVGASDGIAAETAIGAKKSSTPSAMLVGSPSCSRVVTRAALMPGNEAVTRFASTTSPVHSVP